MKNSTIDRYRNAIIELIETKAEHGYVSRDHFNYVTIKHKITRALPTYLQRVNVIEKAGKNRFKFIKSPTVGDIKSIGKIVFTDNALNKRKNKQTNKPKNAEQMSIETSVSNVNEHQASDDFAAQAMAYLESRGFKVIKDKLNFPIKTYMGGIRALTGRNKIIDEIGELDRVINQVAKMERDHIYMAYRACESGKYKSPEQYLKDEYNDFTA